MGVPIVVVASGGLPVTIVSNGFGTPMTIATNGRGIPVTVVASGGLPVTGFTTGPDVTAPIIVSSNAISQPENAILSHTLIANEPVTWAKVGGADAAKFTLTGFTLTLPAKNYEAPDDADANRSYIVQVQATDLASNVSAIQTITVTITDVDEVAPTITSAATFSTPENAAYNHTLTANETVTWSIVGGADAAQFSLAGSTLTMVAQDFEAGASRVVQIRATDTAGNQTNQTITATITNVAEGGLPAINGIVFDGDSTTILGGNASDGTATILPYPQWFQTITGVPSSNIGVAGNTIQNVIARYPTDARPLAATKNTYLIMIGANHGDSAEAMWSALTTLCTMAKADFARVIVATVIPRVSQPGDIPDFIVMVQTNWASIADGMVDHIGPPSIFPTTSTYFLHDGLHQTARGSVRIANNVRTTLGFSYIATDATPNAFSFTDVTGVATNTSTVSAGVELAGMTAPAAFTVTGGTLVVNGIDTGASGTVQPYDIIAVRVTSSASTSTAVNATATVNGVSDTFTVTTGTSAGSAINWDTPPVSGTGTFSGSDRTFQATSNDWLIKSSDAVVTGKKLLAFKFDALAGLYNGCGISSGTPPNMTGTGFGIALLHGAGLYGNGVNIGGLTVLPGEYVGLAIDTAAKRLWATKDGLTFFDPLFRTKAAVEAGTGGVNIAYVVDHGPVYAAAESASNDGNGSRYTLQTAWPWAMLSGYTYLGEIVSDAVAPVLSSPTGVKTGQTTATLSVTTDESNGTLYGVSSAALPTKAQIKAGQDSTGAASSYAFNQLVSGTGAQPRSATGLTASTTYTMRYMQEDASGNQSNIASAAAFTTDAPAASYTGPGDIASGATHHWGLYAYNAAYATGSNPCVDLVDQAGAHPITINIAANGLINVAAITAWVSANSVTTIRVAKVYDQIGTMHMDNSTGVSAYPALTLNAIGTLPAITNPAQGRFLNYAVGVGGVAQPYSLSGVAKRLTGAAAFQSPIGAAGAPALYFWNDAQMIIIAGATVSAPGVATSENVFLTMAAMFNGAASRGAIDNTLGGTCNPGSDTANGSPYIFTNANPMNGQVLGWTFWPGDKSASFAAIHVNNEAMLGI